MKLALVLLVACGSSQPASSTHVTSPPSSGPECVAETPAPACAGDPVVTPTCDHASINSRCTTASAICACTSPFTGGTPTPPNAPGAWRCAAPTRGDGCPGLEPRESGCCMGPDHDCAYPSGRANDDYVLACKRGRWVVVHLPAPFA